MIKRIDQQLRVNRMMIDFFSENYGMIASSKKRYHYMFNYLEIITTVSSILLIYSGTKDNLEKKNELWKYIKQKNMFLFLKLRCGILGNYVYLPGKGGRTITVGGYKLFQKIYKFN